MSKKIDPFVHLHNHTHYSMLDGYATVEDMVKEVARLGQTSIAVTDHGNQHAWAELQRVAENYGIEPIFGMEAYMAPTGITRKDHERKFYYRATNDDNPESSNDVSGRGSYTHLTLLAHAQAGMANLFNFTKQTFTEGNFSKPRGDLDLLSELSEGVLATTGCPSGEIQTRLRLGQEQEAYDYARDLRDILGRENLFVEIMNHDMQIDLERAMIPKLLELSKRMNIPLLATNDAHYAVKSDSDKQEHLLAMQTGAKMSERTFDQGGRRFAFSGNGYYIKSHAEMEALFPEADFPGALSNTLLVAERAKGVRLAARDDLRPEVDIPAGYSLESYFREQVYAGAKERWGAILDKEHADRIEYELDVILNKNFGHYFLVTADFIQWAKDNGIIVGPGRGSGGGSAVAFALKITEVDPLRHSLMFERFLNPERNSEPDFDIDFDESRRAEVIKYVTDKYGVDNVSSIVTFTTLGIKSSIKDAARILESPYGLDDTLTKALPPAVNGREIDFAGVYNPDSKRYNEAQEFRDLVNANGAQEIIRVAQGLEGRNRSTGIHAAGIIISSKKISNHIPLMSRKADGLIITQFDYPTCESLGLIKFDFLGLRNLTILDGAISNIRKTRGIDIDLMDIIHGSLDDKKTFELLQKGNTLGVFQLDSGGMQDLLRRMKPTEFGDIEASLALYRPGPMGMNSHLDYADRKNGVQPIVYPHPEFNESLHDILSRTYGLIVYQEQVMDIARVVANYSLGQADELRRAMGKKKKEVLDKEWVPFHAGAKANGYSEEAIKVIWDTLIPFADYGFNKSHAAAYGLISYATAYFKAHYPAEYMASTLSSIAKEKDKLSLYLYEAKKMGLTITVPKINLAEAHISSSDPENIVFGLGAVRANSPERLQDVIDERNENGLYRSLEEFLDRAPLQNLSKGALEMLVKAGSFDDYGYSRRTLLVNLPELARAERQSQNQKIKGQDDLFSAMLEEEERLDFKSLDIINIPEYDKSTKLSLEKEAIGLYLSGHPLDNAAGSLVSLVDKNIVEVLHDPTIPVGNDWGMEKPMLKIAGLVSSLEIKKTKATGASMAIMTLEDMTDSIEVIAFPKTYAMLQSILEEDKVYVFQGEVSRRDAGSPVVMYLSEAKPIELDDEGYIPFSVRLNADQVMPESLEALSKLVSKNAGTNSPMTVYVLDKDTGQVTTLPNFDRVFINPTMEMINQLKRFFGVNCIGRWR